MFDRSKGGYTKDGLITLLTMAKRLGFDDDIKHYKKELDSLAENDKDRELIESFKEVEATVG